MPVVELYVDLSMAGHAIPTKGVNYKTHLALYVYFSPKVSKTIGVALKLEVTTFKVMLSWHIGAIGVEAVVFLHMVQFSVAN